MNNPTPNTVEPSERAPITSVNQRGSTGNNVGGKLLFVFFVLAVLVMAGVFAMNVARDSSKANEVATADEERAARAQAPKERVFNVDAAPAAAPLPPAVPGAPAGQAGVADCRNGQPSILMLDQAGQPIPGANGQMMRVCTDGQLVAAGPAAAPAAGNGQPVPSRYVGDVMLSSGKTLGMSTSQPAPAFSATPGNIELLKAALAQQQAGNNNGGLAGGAQQNQDRGGALGGMLNATQTAKVSASMLGDRNMILPKGRTIDCAFSTRVVSTVAGMATCVITQDVYSDNGRVILIERGSEAVGEYAANMQQGQRRLAVLWTRIKTPAGVIINLNSPAGDALGAAGIDGKVNNHWWQRLGAAFMLSLVQDAIAYAIASESGAGGAQGLAIYENTAATGNRMAEKVLESTINIKPTLYKNQGDRAVILVARDLDFGSVYGLALK